MAQHCGFPAIFLASKDAQWCTHCHLQNSADNRPILLVNDATLWISNQFLFLKMHNGVPIAIFIILPTINPSYWYNDATF